MNPFLNALKHYNITTTTDTQGYDDIHPSLEYTNSSLNPPPPSTSTSTHFQPVNISMNHESYVPPTSVHIPTYPPILMNSSHSKFIPSNQTRFDNTKPPNFPHTYNSFPDTKDKPILVNNPPNFYHTADLHSSKGTGHLPDYSLQTDTTFSDVDITKTSNTSNNSEILASKQPHLPQSKSKGIVPISAIPQVNTGSLDICNISNPVADNTSNTNLKSSNNIIFHPKHIYADIDPSPHSTNRQSVLQNTHFPTYLTDDLQAVQTVHSTLGTSSNSNNTSMNNSTHNFSEMHRSRNLNLTQQSNIPLKPNTIQVLDQYDKKSHILKEQLTSSKSTSLTPPPPPTSVDSITIPTTLPNAPSRSYLSPLGLASFNHLIKDYLSACGFGFSLMVFESEAKLNTINMNRIDILRTLGLFIDEKTREKEKYNPISKISLETALLEVNAREGWKSRDKEWKEFVLGKDVSHSNSNLISYSSYRDNINTSTSSTPCLSVSGSDLRDRCRLDALDYDSDDEIVSRPEESILSVIINNVCKLKKPGNMREISVDTRGIDDYIDSFTTSTVSKGGIELGFGGGLESKLKEIEDKGRLRIQNEKYGSLPSERIQEYMREERRRCDREVEVRVEAMKQQLISQLRKDVEMEYDFKLQEMRRHMRAMNEREMEEARDRENSIRLEYQVKDRARDSELFALRQELLADLDIVKKKEHQLSLERKRFENQQKAQEKVLELDRHSLKKSKQDLDEKYLQFDSLVTTEVQEALKEKDRTIRQLEQRIANLTQDNVRLEAMQDVEDKTVISLRKKYSDLSVKFEELQQVYFDSENKLKTTLAESKRLSDELLPIKTNFDREVELKAMIAANEKVTSLQQDNISLISSHSHQMEALRLKLESERDNKVRVLQKDLYMKDEEIMKLKYKVETLQGNNEVLDSELKRLTATLQSTQQSPHPTGWTPLKVLENLPLPPQKLHSLLPNTVPPSTLPTSTNNNTSTMNNNTSTVEHTELPTHFHLSSRSSLDRKSQYPADLSTPSTFTSTSSTSISTPTRPSDTHSNSNSNSVAVTPEIPPLREITLFDFKNTPKSMKTSSVSSQEFLKLTQDISKRLSASRTGHSVDGQTKRIERLNIDSLLKIPSRDSLLKAVSKKEKEEYLTSTWLDSSANSLYKDTSTSNINVDSSINTTNQTRANISFSSHPPLSNSTLNSSIPVQLSQNRMLNSSHNSSHNSSQSSQNRVFNSSHYSSHNSLHNPSVGSSQVQEVLEALTRSQLVELDDLDSVVTYDTHQTNPETDCETNTQTNTQTNIQTNIQTETEIDCEIDCETEVTNNTEINTEVDKIDSNNVTVNRDHVNSGEQRMTGVRTHNSLSYSDSNSGEQRMTGIRTDNLFSYSDSNSVGNLSGLSVDKSTGVPDDGSLYDSRSRTSVGGTGSLYDIRSRVSVDESETNSVNSVKSLTNRRRYNTNTITNTNTNSNTNSTRASSNMLRPQIKPRIPIMASNTNTNSNTNNTNTKTNTDNPSFVSIFSSPSHPQSFVSNSNSSSSSPSHPSLPSSSTSSHLPSHLPSSTPKFKPDQRNHEPKFNFSPQSQSKIQLPLPIFDSEVPQRHTGESHTETNSLSYESLDDSYSSDEYEYDYLPDTNHNHLMIPPNTSTNSQDLQNLIDEEQLNSDSDLSLQFNQFSKLNQVPFEGDTNYDTHFNDEFDSSESYSYTYNADGKIPTKWDKDTRERNISMLTPQQLKKLYKETTKSTSTSPLKPLSQPKSTHESIYSGNISNIQNNYNYDYSISSTPPTSKLSTSKMVSSPSNPTSYSYTSPNYDNNVNNMNTDSVISSVVSPSSVDSGFEFEFDYE